MTPRHTLLASYVARRRVYTSHNSHHALLICLRCCRLRHFAVELFRCRLRFAAAADAFADTPCCCSYADTPLFRHYTRYAAFAAADFAIDAAAAALPLLFMPPLALLLFRHYHMPATLMLPLRQINTRCRITLRYHARLRPWRADAAFADTPQRQQC